MEFTVIKRKNKIKVIIENNVKQINKDYCFIAGNIYNINELDNSSKSIESKLIDLYNRYQDKLFNLLNGNFLLILIIAGEIIIVKDKMGSKRLYYTLINQDFICSNNLKYIINNYKTDLNIDRQQLANYLSYNYILEPMTIFTEVKKLPAGMALKFNEQIILNQYYDLIKAYKVNKNKLKNYDLAQQKLEQSLYDAVKMQSQNYKKVGVFFSAGVDSTLVAALLKEAKKEVHTFTIGFNEEERNEAVRSKKIAKHLKTKHHEYYITDKDVEKIIKLVPKIYSEPFADPSLVPTIFLNSKVKNMDIIFTGDGADQLFCGSNVYKEWNISERMTILRQKIQHLKNKNVIVYNPYLKSNRQLALYYPLKSQIYNVIPHQFSSQIKFMLNDIKTFLSCNLFYKVSNPANYYGLNLAHPFVDNIVVQKSLQIKHKFKYYQNITKYILKNIVYQKIPQSYLNQKKNGFGIPLEKYLYNIFYNDIIKFSNYEILKKQNLFDKQFLKLLKKLQNKSLDRRECNIIFAYYIFQLWYQEYIEDLWRDKT